MTPRGSPRKPGAPMAKKRAYHHGDLARSLVAAAVTLIGEKGPDSLTLREVSAAVGVSHGAAYRHFADKQALARSDECQTY